MQEGSTRSSKSHFWKLFSARCIRSREQHGLSWGEISPANVNPSLLALPAERARHPLPNLHPRLFHRAPKGFNNIISVNPQRAEIPNINVVSLQPLSLLCPLRLLCNLATIQSSALYFLCMKHPLMSNLVCRLALMEQFLSAREAAAECEVVGVSPVPLLTIMT